MGPAKMAPELIAKIRNEVSKILANADTQLKLSNAGVEVTMGDGNALAQLIKLDSARYAQLAKSANIKGE
jgi:tripartite-type tricarboxylate transporter receptor subunit TctC